MNVAATSPGDLAARAAGVKRLSAKVFVRDGHEVDQSSFILIFHRWIRGQVFDQLLVDVADYRHVHHGPGVMLVAHEGHYAMDEGEGRLGLMFQQIRWEGVEPGERLRSLLCATFAACRLLEEELSYSVPFRTDEILLRVTDRLAAPNTAETFGQWSRIASGVLEPIFDARGVQIRHETGDAALAMRVLVDGEQGIHQILDRLCYTRPTP